MTERVKRQVKYEVEYLSIQLGAWSLYGRAETLVKARALMKWLHSTGYDARIFRVTREEVK